ncbi:hypothetical protein CUMW_237050 [Citrus unshiu]|uniref:Uncharacterized protein n=1 Tax=Citrus unshiu TaxID=55188 RepID=A0A2H5QJU6_CITUN|nr:hypothetical protein CUMW_237050 [Citrus unshiu]
MSKDDGESSKQAVKRTKKERRAITTALRDELEYLKDIEFSESDTYSNFESDSDATTAFSSRMQKKTRGPAKIDFVAPIDGKRIEGIFNEYGQPVGRNSNRLSSFIGCLVRQMVPLTLDSWHRMKSELRERLWTCVKKKINEYHRTQVSEDASTIHGDALTHVLGKERNGRVRGAESGVTPTLMNLETLSKSHTTQIKMELKDLKKLFEELKAAFIKNTSKQAVINMIKKIYVQYI